MLMQVILVAVLIIISIAVHGTSGKAKTIDYLTLPAAGLGAYLIVSFGVCILDVRFLCDGLLINNLYQTEFLVFVSAAFITLVQMVVSDLHDAIDF